MERTKEQIQNEYRYIISCDIITNRKDLIKIIEKLHKEYESTNFKIQVIS